MCAHTQDKNIKDGEKIDFFDFLSVRLALSIIDKKLHLSIKNRFCPELQKANKTWTFLYEIQFWTTLTNIEWCKCEWQIRRTIFSAAYKNQ